MAAGAIYGSGFLQLRPDLTGFNTELNAKMQGGGLAGLAKKSGLLLGGALLGGIAAGVGTGIKGVIDFAGFEQQMNEVFTLLPGISGDAMDDMTEQVQDFSREFGTLPDEVVPALYQSLSAGVPSDNVFEFLETAQQAALGGVTDLETAVDGISSVVNAYGDDVISAGEASDLMFCLRTDQRVVTVDRGLVPIGELTEGAWVLAYDGQQFVEAWADYVPQPEKPTVRVTTRLGREIITTPNHPYLVERCRHGNTCQRHSCKRTEWVEVQDLEVGDRVAVPTALGQAFGRTVAPEHKSALLGLWLAEGDSKVSSVNLTSMDYGAEIKRWAADWGCSVTADGGIRHRVVCKGVPGNPVADWLRRIGLGDCSAATKHIPAEVFTWDRASTASLLRWLFNGDGWLSATPDSRRAGGYGYQLGFCSGSERLVRDVSHMLLRFGIVGRVRFRAEVNAWCWETNRYNEIARFLDHIGIDRASVEIFRAYVPEKQRHRENVVEFDPIVEIEDMALAPVADLHVAELHNFVAEDIVAHNTAVRLGKTNFDELSNSLFNVTPTASALGVQFGDVTAALAAMTAQGTPTSVATTQLRQLFVELSKEGGAAAEAFEGIAGKSFQEFIAEGGNVAQALELMEEAAGESGVGLQDMFGSVEAGAAALSLTGSDAFTDALDEMANSAGATEGAFEQMDQGLGRSWDKIKAAVSNALLDIGQRLAPFVQTFSDFLATNLPIWIETASGWFDRLSEWWNTNGPTITAVVSAVFDAVSEAISTVIGVIQTVIGWFQTGEEETTGAMSGIQAFAAEVWPKIQGVISGAMEIIRTVIETVTGVIQGIWDRHGERILRVITTAWNNIKNVIDSVLGIIQGIIDTVMGILTGNWDRAWEGIKGIVSSIWDGIKSIVDTAITIVQETIGGVLDEIKRLWNTAWDTVSSFLSDTWDDIVSGVETGIEDVKEFFVNLPGNILDWLGDMGSLLFDIGRDIISGLWDGLKDMWSDVTGWFSDLGGQIADLKGPPSYDRKILTENGRLIMEGFQRGLTDGWGDVEDFLGSRVVGITGSLSPAMAVAEPMGTTGALGRSITVHTTGDAEVLAREIMYRTEWHEAVRGRG